MQAPTAGENVLLADLGNRSITTDSAIGFTFG